MYLTLLIRIVLEVELRGQMNNEVFLNKVITVLETSHVMMSENLGMKL